EVGVGSCFELCDGASELGRFVLGLIRPVETALACSGLLVSFLKGAGDFLVVAFDGVPRGIRHTVCHQLGGSTEQGVAVLNMRVEEGEREPWFDGFHPEAHLAELDRHGVEIDAVDRAAYDLTECVSIFGCRGSAVRLEASDVCGEATSRGKQEVSAATCWIDHREFEQRFCRIVGVSGDRALYDGLDGAVEEHLHEAVRGVIAARELAGMAFGFPSLCK